MGKTFKCGGEEVKLIGRGQSKNTEELGTAKKKRIHFWWLIIMGFLAALWALALFSNWHWEDLRTLRYAGADGQSGSGLEMEIWRWSNVSPTKDLIWHRCYEKYDCAKLDASYIPEQFCGLAYVPLDWLDPSDDLRASIAIIRYNATDRTDYKGPVVINPGGPGGSGVWFIKHLAPYYQSVVGANHDIISFDPRGVGYSTPFINCWGSATQNARIWNLKEPDVLDAHPGTLYDAYAHASAFSQQCLSFLGPNPSPTSTKLSKAGIGRFVSTASGARDMLEIVNAAGLPKLKYWGFSYGTFLGATFASLYPEKVGLMVNDGNVDAVEYSSGRGIHFVQDTEEVMRSFYRFCHSAGEERCAFHAESPQLVQRRLERLLNDVRRNPVIVPALTLKERPQIVSFSKIRRMISSSLYRPLVMFPPLAEALAALENGNGRVFVELIAQGSENQFLCDVQEGDPEHPTPEIPEAEGNPEAMKAILCSDGGWMKDTAEEFGVYVGEVTALSRSAGAIMAQMRLGCVKWGVQAKWRFDGPFKGNTSNPILFVANKADNVTPLRSALQNAKGFPDSVVLLQDSYGHTSLSTPSRCTAKLINAYFQNGSLPAVGTVCAPDLVPFEPYNITSVGTKAGDDQQLDIALLELMNAPVVSV